MVIELSCSSTVSDEYLKVGVKVTDDNNNHHFAMAPAAALTQPHC